MKIKIFIRHNLIYFVLIIAALLRLWKLDVNPPHLSPDEASLGYNAYSILKTGRDEYGKVFPIIFKSFGDYKPGLYVYSAVPFVAIFGLNEWSVRLPSALAGIASVYLLYLLVGEFIRNKNRSPITDHQSLVTNYWSPITDHRSLSTNHQSPITNHQFLPLISAFLLAVSPWHIHFSRGAWEINMSLTLTLAGTLFFLRSLNHAKYLILSSLAFSLTFIMYQGAKLSTSVVVLILLIVFIKELIAIVKQNIRIILISLILAAVIASPILISFYKGQTGRLKVFSIFSYPRSNEYTEAMLKQNNETIGDINYLLFHNEPLNFKRGILGRYFNHFSARFLFFEGDYQNPKHNAPNQGMLMYFDLILIPIGIYGLVRRKSHFSKFVFLWLILTPLPAVLTRDQVQAVRSYNMVIPLILISSFGLSELYEAITKIRENGYKFFSKVVIIFSGTLFIASLVYFVDSYFIHMPIHNAKYWNYGYREVVKNILPIQNNYKTVYFQQSYDQPYIYYLFYSKYDPLKYQKQAELSYYLGPDVGLVEGLDNIKFAGWSWPYATGEKSTLIIGNSVAIPADFNPKDYVLIKEVKFPDKYMTAFRIVETK